MMQKIEYKIKVNAYSKPNCSLILGYEFHHFRMEWLKRRRERLARKLQETQKQIDIMSEPR